VDLSELVFMLLVFAEDEEAFRSMGSCESRVLSFNCFTPCAIFAVFSAIFNVFDVSIFAAFVMFAAVASLFALITFVPFSLLPFFFVFGLLDVVVVVAAVVFAAVVFAAVVEAGAGDVLFCSFLAEFLFFDVVFFLVGLVLVLFSEGARVGFVPGVGPPVDGGWEREGRVIFDEDG